MPVTRLITQRKFGSYIVWTSPKYICNLVKYSGTYVSVLNVVLSIPFRQEERNRACVKLRVRYLISCPHIMQTTGKRLNAKGRNGSEIHWWKEARVIHLNSIPIYFVAIILLCLYGLHFVADSYKTGSTPIADFNRNGNCCLCLILV